MNYDQVMRAPDDWFNGNVSFRSPTPRVETGTKESLDAHLRRLHAAASRRRSQVIVDRGERAQVGNACTGGK